MGGSSPVIFIVMPARGWRISGQHEGCLSRRWALFGFVSLVFAVNSLAQDRPRVEVPYGNLQFVLQADRIERLENGEILAEGDVHATYSDASLTAQRVTYDPVKDLVIIEGNFEIKRARGWIQGTRAELNVREDTGIIYDPYGFTDEELFVRARKLTKVGPTTYIAEDGYLTACEDAVPKWSFKISKATINIDSTARVRNTLFRIKKAPIFYFPYLILPTAKKERSSGLMLPTTGNSNNKGRRLSNRFYLVMGRSSDVMLEHEYYSERGHGAGFNLRSVPNAVSRLDLTGRFVNDRLNQGGGSIEGVGYTSFGSGFRAVADFSLVSSFQFRQVFSDNFFTATRPSERSRLFLTNNYRLRSLNLLLSREQTVAPGRNIITQATPAVQLQVLGQKLGNLPLHVDLESSVGGFSRTDQLIETPRISQRFDLFPKIYFSVPLFQGLRITPRLGLRETFYSDGIDLNEEGNRVVTGNSVHRQYFDFTADLKGWGVSRIFGEPGGKQWKHLVEPEVRYRLLSGVDEFDRIIRFDYVDAVADTNEVEYAIVNRLFVKRSGNSQVHEWLSIKIAQKHFFDPTFGGALQEGRINQFFPLNSLSGHPYAVGYRDFSPITTLVRLTPDSRVSFDFRSDYDTQSGNFRSLSATGYYRSNNLTAATTYFVTNELLTGIGRSNQLQGRLGIGQHDRGLSAFGYFSYDIRDSTFLNHLVRLNYFWDCCGVSVETGGFNLTTRKEQEIRFTFYLKGIGAFGTIRRPELVF